LAFIFRIIFRRSYPTSIIFLQNLARNQERW
jgi:hypothetical protein